MIETRTKRQIRLDNRQNLICADWYKLKEENPDIKVTCALKELAAKYKLTVQGIRWILNQHSITVNKKAEA